MHVSSPSHSQQFGKAPVHLCVSTTLEMSRPTSKTACEETAEDDENVPKKGQTASVIWKWFGYLKSDKAQTSIK